MSDAFGLCQDAGGLLSEKKTQIFNRGELERQCRRREAMSRSLWLSGNTSIARSLGMLLEMMLSFWVKLLALLGLL